MRTNALNLHAGKLFSNWLRAEDPAGELSKAKLYKPQVRVFQSLFLEVRKLSLITVLRHILLLALARLNMLLLMLVNSYTGKTSSSYF